MFGEYGIFYQGLFIAAVCDSQLFVKITTPGEDLLPNAPEAPPYEGAKPYLLVESLEDKALLAKLLLATYQALPPKKERPKKKKTTDPCVP